MNYLTILKLLEKLTTADFFAFFYDFKIECLMETTYSQISAYFR